MGILKSFSINCNCTSEKSIFLDDEILDSISDYYDEMEDYLYRNKLPEKALFNYFKEYPLPSLPIDPFSLNYLIFGIDPQNYYSPFLLSKLCEVFDVNIDSEEFFGKEFVNKLQNNNLDLVKRQNNYLLSSDQAEIDFVFYENKLKNYYNVNEKNFGERNDIVSIHKITTWSDSKALIINNGPEYLSHETAQLLHELNVIFFSYELELIQQLRGKEKSRTELEKLQKKYIFTDWGTIYPYVFPQSNFSILEDQKTLRRKKFG
ncbi:MAG: hypothetical protein HeimC3_34750 [Candidatus Heimdallarchaeota archaeon LC_3]|nr:MAG: hypothetical protein HeimC3_34750 [Candidatus Heimdallarchaeota archaeon LC_3]